MSEGNVKLNEEWARLKGWTQQTCTSTVLYWVPPDFSGVWDGTQSEDAPNISGSWAVLGPELEKAEFYECYPEAEGTIWRGVVGRNPMCGCQGDTQLITLTRALIAWEREKQG